MADYKPARCVHADAHWLYAVIFDDLRLCGCGYPEDVLDLLLDMLRACPWYEPPGWQEFSERLTGPGFEFIAHQLSAADLIEHGSAVGGSWLTDKGKRFLALAPAFDFDDNQGYACSDCPTQESAEPPVYRRPTEGTLLDAGALGRVTGSPGGDRAHRTDELYKNGWCRACGNTSFVYAEGGMRKVPCPTCTQMGAGS